MSDLPSAICLIDGQNLFRCAWEAFGDGYHYPNYDAKSLSYHVAKQLNLSLKEVRFYTGIPTPHEDAIGAHTWRSRINSMKRSKVEVITRPLRYEDTFDTDSDGRVVHKRKAREKGIDVRIALDFVSIVLEKRAEAIILFSQDQDLKEAVIEAREIFKKTGSFIQLFCAFPENKTKNYRGVDGMQWVRICKEDYDRCRDLTDYRKGFPGYK